MNDIDKIAAELVDAIRKCNGFYAVEVKVAKAAIEKVIEEWELRQLPKIAALERELREARATEREQIKEVPLHKPRYWKNYE